MDYLSICAIVKDENAYLPEWIEYHKLVGVEKFYLYDNGSKIPVAETLAEDASTGRVVVTPFPGQTRQFEAYLDCVNRRKQDTSWMAFIDIDEFIVPKSSGSVTEILRGHERFSALALSWRVFASSGHLNRPPGLQIENFIMAAPDQFWWNTHVKTIAKPALVSGFLNPHYCLLKEGYAADTDGARVDGPFNSNPKFEKIQINHYYTRSRAEFEEKLLRGSAMKSPKYIETFDVLDHNCTVRDGSARRFAPKLRAAMELRKNHGP